jgi:hypothetical protein
METQVQAQEQVIEKPAEPVVEQKQEQVDLVARVSQVKTPDVAKKEIDEKFNINDLDAHIEKLPDPALKEQVLGLKKSLLKGENQKYQEIANLRKQYESELAKMSTWTPERLQQEMNKPDFVRAAQSIISPTQQDSSSMLSEQEKRQLEENNRQVQALMNQNQQLLKIQQDSQLKSRYANYDPTIIDNVLNDLQAGKIMPTREDFWKVIDYENAVKRAYQLGLMDKNTQNQERVQGMTFETGRNMQQPTSLERQKGETTQQFILRSYQEHAKKK